MGSPHGNHDQQRCCGPSRTVTGSDVEAGIVRVPRDSKWCLHDSRKDIEVILRRESLGERIWDLRSCVALRPLPGDHHRTAQTNSVHSRGAADLHRRRIPFLDWDGQAA
jgi:hypothetical protein